MENVYVSMLDLKSKAVLCIVMKAVPSKHWVQMKGWEWGTVHIYRLLH